jgi:hypothetical protein
VVVVAAENGEICGKYRVYRRGRKIWLWLFWLFGALLSGVNIDTYAHKNQ